MACATRSARPGTLLPGARTARRVRGCWKASAALDTHAGALPGRPIEELRRIVQLFYTEALGNATPELLPSLCNRAVTYCDARGAGCDVFGCLGLAQMIEDVCATHPLLHVEVDDITVDASRRCAVAEWHATAAHLLPGRGGAKPTGLVSEICGLDEIKFGTDGRISSILSFRDRFAEEEEAALGAGGAGGDGSRPAPPVLE